MKSSSLTVVMVESVKELYQCYMVDRKDRPNMYFLNYWQTTCPLGFRIPFEIYFFLCDGQVGKL